MSTKWSVPNGEEKHSSIKTCQKSSTSIFFKGKHSIIVLNGLVVIFCRFEYYDFSWILFSTVVDSWIWCASNRQILQNNDSLTCRAVELNGKLGSCLATMMNDRYEVLRNVKGERPMFCVHSVEGSELVVVSITFALDLISARQRSDPLPPRRLLAS